MKDNERDELFSIRKRIVLTGMMGANKAAHIASALSSVEILYTLYHKIDLKFDASDPEWEQRDRVIMSKGHGVLAQYVILSDCGYFKYDDLLSFSNPGSIFGGEPDATIIPGIEASTGSLGHGLSYGIGLALSYKVMNKSNNVYVILGDGESEEGSMWEAAMTASKYRLNNLCAILDCNNLQKMGTVHDVAGIDGWKDKWTAFGWHVMEVDGHNVDELAQAIKDKKEDLPNIIIAKTTKGKGISFMENNPAWHYRIPGIPEMKKLEKEMGITKEDIKNAECIHANTL